MPLQVVFTSIHMSTSCKHCSTGRANVAWMHLKWHEESARTKIYQRGGMCISDRDGLAIRKFLCGVRDEKIDCASWKGKSSAQVAEKSPLRLSRTLLLTWADPSAGTILLSNGNYKGCSLYCNVVSSYQGIVRSISGSIKSGSARNGGRMAAVCSCSYQPVFPNI